ncbi:MAG: T9SS type A sorting domain-containing protein [Cyclobacteriaceae bacterium]|nr:T9SS type A sorting domain-containing protein [Cyclobacteriaceae bacterium]
MHYNEFIKSGMYQVEVTTGNKTVTGKLIIKETRK